MQTKEDEPKLKKIVAGVDSLSLGTSMVVAVLIGVAIESVYIFYNRI